MADNLPKKQAGLKDPEMAAAICIVVSFSFLVELLFCLW
jgi:hypothetical protein